VSFKPLQARLLTHPRWQIRLAVGVGALAVAMTCQAQVRVAEALGSSLEQLLSAEVAGGSSNVAVSTAARMVQGADLAPAVTDVITWQEIQRLGLRSMAEVLRRLTGVQARSDYTSVNLVVRGMGPGDFNNRVLVLLDGMRLNNNIYDQAALDRDFPVDVSQIERVEFTPGPGSALYGGNALLGVVNVMTFRANQLRGSTIHLRQAPGGNSEVALSHGQRFEDGSEWSFLASWLTDPRLERTLDRTSEDWQQIEPYEWDRARRASFGYRREGLSLRAGADDRVLGRGAYWEGLEYRQGVETTQHRYAHAAYEAQVGAGWDLNASLSWQQSFFRSEDPDIEDPVPYRYEILGRWLNGELRVGRGVGAAHYLMAGLDAQRDVLQAFRFDTLRPAFSTSTAKGNRLGLFVQDEWRLAERQRLVLGLRHDRLEDQPARWNPRVAYVWSPSDGSSLKMAFGTAFRPPNRFEALSNETRDIPPLSPERLRSVDVSWDGQLGHVWRYRVSAYRMRLTDPIVRDIFGFGHHINDALNRGSGFELSAEARWPSGWQLGVKWSRENTRLGDSDLPVSYSPKQTLRWSASTPMLSAWQLALHGEVYDRSTGFIYDHAGYGLVHANVLWRPVPGLTASLGGQNLTGKRYLQSVSEVFDRPLIREGRRWLLTLQWQANP
jgi:iron complex outermembrane recepter protein